MAFTKRRIRGFVPVDETGDPGDVVFLLNGKQIASCRPEKSIVLGSDREFVRSLDGLWPYLGKGDTIEVHYRSRPLPIALHGYRYVHRGSKESRFGELIALLDSGFQFTKNGSLARSLRDNRSWQDAVMALFDAVRLEVLRRLTFDVFPIYGSMLGAVRESNFIANDDDFDAVFVSPHCSPEDVKGDVATVARVLLAAGYNVEAHSTVLKVFSGDHHIDLFFSWFDLQERYQISYGYHGPPVMRSDDLSTMVPCAIGRFTVEIPKNSKDILLQIYGDTWVVPNPGFQHSRTRVVQREYLLDERFRTAIYWEQFYRDQREPGQESSFARFVTTFLPDVQTVVDIGCGSGHDSLFFARQRMKVIACDQAHMAAHLVTAFAGDDVLDRLDFEVVDIADADALAAVIKQGVATAAAPDRLMIYLRFMLHAIDRASETALFDRLAEDLPRGSLVAFEFRTWRDARSKKVHGGHFRRFPVPFAIRRALSRRGFDVVYLKTGRGMSVYKNEDPHLCRLIARRGGWGTG